MPIVLDRIDPSLLVGSTRHVRTSRTLAIDGGPGWTGIVAREGTDALAGATVGLRPGARLRKDEIPDIDDHDAWLPYFGRVLDTAVDVWDRTWGPDAIVRVVLEGAWRPQYKVKGRGQRIRDCEWFPVVQLMTGAVGRFGSQVYLVRPQGLGERHQASNGGTGNVSDYYPPELYGSSSFPNDHPKGTNNHVQSAYDAAAVAEVELTAVTEGDVARIMGAGLVAA